MKPTSAVIIGAGIGGLATAVHLANQGLQVTIVEKNSRPGGRCDRIVREGHTFDTGPTLFVMPLLYDDEFKRLGVSVHNALELQRVDPTYHLVFDDGTNLSLTSDMRRMQEQIESFEPGSFHGLMQYLDEGRRHYELATKWLVQKDFRKITDFINLRNLPLLFTIKPLVQHYHNMSRYFDNPRLKAAFTFQDVYMGLSPFQAPATFSLMPYTELAHGVWYPKGGMYQVVEVLMEIAQQAGVEFVFSEAVNRIDVNRNKAHGVILEDDYRIEADVVVANADLPYVYKQLLPKTALTDRLTHKKFSCSVISFFWGLDREYESLAPHTLFLADDYRENFVSINQDLSIPDNPSLYIHAPVRLNTSMAPPGEDTLIAIVPVGHIDETDPQDWNQIQAEARQAVFRRLALLGINDLQEHIKFEICFTPQSWCKRYNLLKGATHGLSHNLTQLGYFRPKNRHPHYQNLYFVGASTHPGTGVPTALISARLVAERIRDEIILER
jgi:phytoene desaturase